MILPLLPTLALALFLPQAPELTPLPFERVPDLMTVNWAVE